jgi:O-antigen/teichoic acid export membrane protein
MICSQLACSGFGLFLLNHRARFSTNFRSYKAFLRETTPIALSLAFTFLLGQADLWTCNFLLRKEDVALYGIAQKFCIFVSMPMMVFGSVITPKLAELLALKDMVKMRALVGRGTYLTALSAFAIFIGVAGVGWPVMGFFFGAKYTSSYPLFLVLGVGQVLHSIAGPNGYLLLLSGAQRSAMTATIFSALFLGGAAWIGAMYWGTLGIALASTAALSVQSFLMWYEVKRRLNFSPHFDWRKGRSSVAGAAKIRSEN